MCRPCLWSKRERDTLSCHENDRDPVMRGQLGNMPRSMMISTMQQYAQMLPHAHLKVGWRCDCPFINAHAFIGGYLESRRYVHRLNGLYLGAPSGWADGSPRPLCFSVGLPNLRYIGHHAKQRFGCACWPVQPSAKGGPRLDANSTISINEQPLVANDM